MNGIVGCVTWKSSSSAVLLRERISFSIPAKSAQDREIRLNSIALGGVFVTENILLRHHNPAYTDTIKLAIFSLGIAVYAD